MMLSRTILLACIITGTFGFLYKHPNATTDEVEEGSTVSFKCVSKNCTDCPVIWTLTDTETGRPVEVPTPDTSSSRVVPEFNLTISKIDIVAERNTIIQCIEHNPVGSPKNHFSRVALLRVLPKEQGSGTQTPSTDCGAQTPSTDSGAQTPALGLFKEHPQSVTATEGSVANFSCKIKNCEHCSLFWRVHNLETCERIFPTGANVESSVNGNGRVNSHLQIVAANSSVVQCLVYNPNASKPMERRIFSKYALLHVLRSEGSAE